jgi:hypothetical protein
MTDIAKVLKQARPREQTVPVCVRGDLSGEVERLSSELARVSEDWEPADLTEEHPGRVLAAEMRKVREQARAAEVPFRLRYIGDRAYSDLLAAHPSEDPQEAFNSDTFPRALIAACCVDPVMTEEHCTELFEVISQGEIKRLFDAAWDVHNGAGIVPFSLAASALLASLTGEK